MQTTETNEVLGNQMTIEEVDITLMANPALTKLMSSMLTIQNDLNCKFVSPGWKDEASLHERIDYLPTILDEAGELMRSNLQWKWWKKATPADHANMKVELIDILHFAMSEALVRGPSLEAVGAEMAYWYEITYMTETSDSEDAAVLPVPREEPVYDFQKKKRALFSFLAEAFLFYSQEYQDEAVDEIIEQSDLEVNEDDPTSMLPLELNSEMGSSVNWGYFWQVALHMGITLDDIFLTYIGKASLNALRSAKGDAKGEYQKHWWNDSEDNLFLMKHLAYIQREGLVAATTVQTVAEWLDITYQLFLKGARETEIEMI